MSPTDKKQKSGRHRTTLIDGIDDRIRSAVDQAGDPIPSLVVLTGLKFGATVPVGPEMTLGREACDVIFQDGGVSRKHARIVKVGTSYAVEDLGSANGTFVNGERIFTLTVLAVGDKIHLGHGTLLRFAMHDGFDQAFQSKLADGALRDPLTGLYNRRYFMRRLESELSFSKRHGSYVSLIRIDIDRFRDFNARHGHLAGDAALVEIARVASAVVRAEDILARLGSDDFAVVSRALGTSDAAALAERVRASVSATPFAGGETITLSAGVVCHPEVEAATAERFLRAADATLFLAHRKGGDSIAIHASARKRTGEFQIGKSEVTDIISAS